MPAKLYPFIDIAVHERVREHFVKGDAAALFSPDMSQVLWSNGEGALLFGLPSIYDFIDSGANRNEAAYRQMEAAARQLARSGDRRAFLMRIASGFQRVSVNASVEMITVRPGETAILFAAPRTGKPLVLKDPQQRMISGFDDPDTHMAVLDGDGAVLAASPGFDALAMTPQNCRSLVSAVSCATATGCSSGRSRPAKASYRPRSASCRKTLPCTCFSLWKPSSAISIRTRTSTRPR
ncbi:hypothetical protein LP421_15105 [Rhizobium sp. RCAM05350]|nr:hypothetical protein LP421_15105 [Rhizobium sp. RCAM05350]